MSASRIVKFAVVIALAALLAACTFTRFAYNQADIVAAWMVDDYFGLDQLQKQEFNKRFERFHAWHRHEQLPEYSQFMRAAQTRAQRGLYREDVAWFTEGLRARLRIIIRHAAPEAAVLLATLTPAQIEVLQRRLEKANRKFVKTHKLNGTPEERQEAEAKRMVKAIRDWLSPLTAEQEQRVAVLARELPPVQHLRYAERQRRQKEFIELLAHRTEDRARFTARLIDWASNWERGRSADYQKRLDANWAKRAEIYVAIDRMFTPEQRTAYVQRIQSYSDDFAQLARREGGATTAAAR